MLDVVRISLTVCDVCADPLRSTERWQLTGEVSNVQLDLCEEHAQPLLDLLVQAGKDPSDPGSGRRERTSRSDRDNVISFGGVEHQRRNR